MVFVWNKTQPALLGRASANQRNAADCLWNTGFVVIFITAFPLYHIFYGLSSVILHFLKIIFALPAKPPPQFSAAAHWGMYRP